MLTSLPPQLHKFEKLETLDVSHNKIFGFLPTTFGAGLYSIRYLDLSYNEISGTFDEANQDLLADMSKIQAFSIAHNT